MGEEIRSQDEHYEGHSKEKREEGKLEDEAPERQRLGVVCAFESVGTNDSRQGAYKHDEEPDVDSKCRIWRGKDHGDRPASVGGNDETE